ncbi:hypothetical protein, partial [Candidatus Ichthyocystis sparus]
TKGGGKAPAKKRRTASVVSSSATTASTTATVTGKGVGTKDRGKAPAKKRGTAAVSSSEATLDPDVLSSLGVNLSPEIVGIIATLFHEVCEFARNVYDSMEDKQLPQSESEKLSVTGRGIWYNTYSSMCRCFFVSRCFGEYHASYRPVFVRNLPRTRIMSDSSDHSEVPLTGEVLLGFLSNLDCAIRSEIESIFNSRLSEVSVSLEEESLSSIVCQDFADVLSIAGIPKVSSSVMIASFIMRKEKPLGVSSVEDVTVPADDETRTVVRAPVWIPPVAGPSELSLLSSVVGSGDGPSSGPIAAGGCADSDNATVSTRSRRATRVDVSVQESPVSAEDDCPSSTVSVPSYVQCTDSLGVDLHPDSIQLIHNLFRDVHLAFAVSFSKSICNYISIAMSSGLSTIERYIWLKTYRELYLHNFTSRCLGTYHNNHRPAFILDLANVRVSSDSSDLGLLLSGASLVNFLSRLDQVVEGLISSAFNSRWCIEVDNACSGLEDESLNSVGYGDLICVLDTAGIPEAAFSVYQRRRELVARERASRGRVVRRGGTSGSSSKITREGKASRTGTASTGTASAGVQIRPKLSSRSGRGLLSRSRSQSKKQSRPLLLLEMASDRSSSGFIKSLFYRCQSASLSAIGTVSTSEVGGDVLLPTADDGVASDLREDELSAPLPESVVESDVSLSLPPSSAGELLAVGVVSESRGSGDDSPLPTSSPSVGSSRPSFRLSSSPSEAGLDADVSSSSSGSPVSIREVGLTTEVVVSGPEALVSESTPVPSSEQVIMPITSPSSVSTAPIGESSTAAGSSSYSYFRGPKKLMMMQFKGTSGVSTGSGVSAGFSSSASMSSSAVAGPSSYVPMAVGSVQQQVAAATDTDNDDVGVRLAALLNRGLPPSPPSAGESSGSMRGGRGRAGIGRAGIGRAGRRGRVGRGGGRVGRAGRGRGWYR